MKTEDAAVIIIGEIPRRAAVLNLPSQIEELVKKENNPALTNGLGIHPQYGDSTELRCFVNELLLGGALARGSDSKYRIAQPRYLERKAHFAAKTIPKDKLESLKKLGRQIEYD